jgi:hypothetical protein
MDKMGNLMLEEPRHKELVGKWVTEDMLLHSRVIEDTPLRDRGFEDAVSWVAATHGIALVHSILDNNSYTTAASTHNPKDDLVKAVVSCNGSMSLCSNQMLE